MDTPCIRVHCACVILLLYVSICAHITHIYIYTYINWNWMVITNKILKMMMLKHKILLNTIPLDLSFLFLVIPNIHTHSFIEFISYFVFRFDKNIKCDFGKFHTTLHSHADAQKTCWKEYLYWHTSWKQYWAECKRVIY